MAGQLRGWLWLPRAEGEVRRAEAEQAGSWLAAGDRAEDGASRVETSYEDGDGDGVRTLGSGRGLTLGLLLDLGWALRTGSLEERFGPPQRVNDIRAQRQQQKKTSF